MTGNANRHEPSPGRTYKIGADIGGTFTDLVLISSDGEVETKKISSTPDSYGRAIVAGIQELIAEKKLPPSAITEVVHASTVATNAILQFSGARTGLITTRGFRDVLELRRLRIPVLYDLQYQKAPPLVPRRLRVEVDERMGPRGQVWRPLDEASVIAAARAMAEAGVEAVAVALLHSYGDARHERRVADVLRAHLPAGVFVTCSADILPEIREYERTSTAVVNAYVGPVVRDYIAALARDLQSIGLRGRLQIMQSNGGIMTAEAATRKPVYIVESGPAAGVIACAKMARSLGHANVISFDMGGTTAKAAIIEDGEPAMTTEYEVGSGINLSSKLVKGGGYPIKLPFIDVSEIGAGGGSIVAVDETGGLRVGPRSAGAAPGPVCYDIGGTEPTFTDAMVALGYLNPSAIAGGRVKLNAARACAALETQIAKPLGLSLHDAAYGIYMIASATMTRAAKAVTTYRGRDPRDFTLVAFGGNGPMAAAEVAKALNIGTVLIPPAPGVFSALGLLLSDVEHQFARSIFRDISDLSDGDLARAYSELEAEALAALAADGYPRDSARFRRFADLRYAGQAYELSVPVEDPVRAAELATIFHEEHLRTYGHRSERDPVDLVAIKLNAQVVGSSRRAEYAALSRGVGRGHHLEERRRAYFGKTHGFIETRVVSRDALPQTWTPGPLIVEEYDSTCVVPPTARVRKDALANIEIEVPRELDA